MAFPLQCTVRGCLNPLVRSERGLTCRAGHHFDQAKEGYWNLLQPQDRKSKRPGDCDAAVLARHRWLRRDYHMDLVRAIGSWMDTVHRDRQPLTMELGCGEGTLGRLLMKDDAAGYVGIDLSKRAIKLACRAWRDATWVLANADRSLPAASGSVDCVLSLFGRRPASEIHRVLSVGGHCIVAIPGETDLIQLRKQTQASGRRRSRVGGVVAEMTAAGLTPIQHQTCEQTVCLDPDAVADAMAMTYRAVRFSQQAKLSSLSSAEVLEVTLSADLILFRKINEMSGKTGL